MRIFRVASLFFSVFVLLSCMMTTNALFDTYLWGVVMFSAITIALLCIKCYTNNRYNGILMCALNSISAIRYYEKSRRLLNITLCLLAWLFYYRVYILGLDSVIKAVVLPIASIVVTIVTVVILFRVLCRRVKNNVLYNYAFAVGGLMAVGAYIMLELPNRYLLLVHFVFSCGLALMLVAIDGVNRDLNKVTSVARLSQLDMNTLVGHNIAVSQIYAVVIFVCIHSVLLVTDRLDLMADIVLGLCAVVTLYGIVCSLKNPIDRLYSYKLDQYIYRDTSVNRQLLQKQLRSKLVTGKSRASFVIGKKIAKLVLPTKLIGKDNITTKTPAVFVANHYEIYGPIATILHLPVYVRPWIINNMLDEDIVAEQMKGAMDNVFGWMPKAIRRKLPNLVKRLVLYTMWSTDPIPVHRGNVREVIATLNLTIEAMQQGDNILIFPENPATNYAQEGVDPFYTGFAEIGNRYYKATGKNTSFYPVYVDKRNRQVVIGKAIMYDNTNERQSEKQRIVTELNNTMSVIAEQQLAIFNAKKRKKKDKKSAE